MTIEGFYKKFTGLLYGPESNLEWLRIPESFLATATNGQIFYDGEGTFTSIRERLLRFYPAHEAKGGLLERRCGMRNQGKAGKSGSA
ncbi:DUF4037 domain-containing protein [Clostridiales bacterium]|nr:DUF4037 domain-containing protein [Clostridiales bacterium]